MSSSGKHDPADAREVDRLLRQLILGEESRPPVTRSGPVPGPAGSGPRHGVPPGAQATARDRPRPVPARRAPAAPGPFAVWSRVLLGAILAGALTQWPYATCGPALAAYLSAVAVVLAMGLWASRSAWRARLGYAHTLGIALLFAGAVLAAAQLLPRLGYAGLRVPWACGG